jgi:pimeloyl-ACP methyl ester carboxylesterase
MPSIFRDLGTPALPGFQYTMTAQADAMTAFIKAQNLANPVVIGRSTGGGVALGIAALSAKGGTLTISKLVVIDPVAYLPTKSPLGRPWKAIRNGRPADNTRAKSWIGQTNS